jgi:hypothetical protein
MRLKDRIDRAAKGACDKKMLARRRLAEKIILEAVRDRLNRTEHIGYLLERVEVLREELDGLRRSREKVFQPPPVKRIEERLAGMQKVLERRTERSAFLLRSLLGGIQLEPTCGEIGRPS